MIATLLVLALNAAPNDLATAVKAKLKDAPVLTGTFDQNKQVKGFKRPLKSSGTYRVAKGEGVQWNTLKPFASELTVRAGDITSKQNGVEVFKLDAKSEPGVRIITELLFSLLSGDLPALAPHFDTDGEITEASWRIELTPKDAALKKVFVRITLKGDDSVRSVHLLEAGGDATLITLTPTP
ncbi:MAG: outer membrane lipoprotein carrier protein LolA [Archangium sp.]